MSERLTVAVTGASGYIGSRAITALLADDRVGRVLGFDVRPSSVAHDDFVFDLLDVRSPALAARLKGVDVLVHLAFAMNPMHDEALMREINVDGTHNTFRAAADAGVRKIVYTSSAVVYGAHRDNDVPLTESSPLRANLDLSYAAHKLEVEYLIRDFRAANPDVVVTVFRPAIVFGPDVDNAWSRMLEAPVLVSVAGYEAPLQFVHRDDVVGALTFAVHRDLDGPFNLSPPGWLTPAQMLSILERSRRVLSEPVAFALVDRLWSLGLAEAPAAILHYLMHPWVVSSEKLAEAGFTCRTSNEEAFAARAADARSFVRLRRFRFRRSHAKIAFGGATALSILVLASAPHRRAH